jgi:TatD DNase family protein
MKSAQVPAIIDTHAHLDDAAFASDLDAVMEASSAAGVCQFINIGYSPESWLSSRALQNRYPQVGLALGLHPQNAGQWGPQLARGLVRAVRDFGAIAVGETGFDFARLQPGFKEQERAFRLQLEIASSEGLPTIIHQRDAADALIAELDRWPSLTPIVLHSFDGTDLLADWAIERGCFIGIGGLATRPRSEKLRGLLSRIPVERLLLETDAPYLPPPGAGRRNTPANLRVMARILAPLWHLNEEELCRATTANAVALFGCFSVDQATEVTKNDQTPQSSITDRNVESREASRDPRTPAA